MNVAFQTVDPAGIHSSALIVFLFADDEPSLTRRPELAGLADLIGPRILKGDFVAKPTKVLPLFAPDIPGPERVILTGLGERREATPEKLRQAAAKAVQAVADMKLDEAAMLLPPDEAGLGGAEAVAETLVLGARLGLYQYRELKTGPEEVRQDLERLTLVGPGDLDPGRIRKAAETAGITAEAVIKARDLINRPPNLLYPETLAEEARAMAREAGLAIQVLDTHEARSKGMGAFLGVAQGSDHPGRVIVLEYRGAEHVRPLALVGKAITFDSGGLCIKPPDGMKDMKTDMAGGAAVLATMWAAARLGLEDHLIGVIPAAENMPSSKAYRPGDVLRSMSGQTVEVINTDAEGRLILADALTLAGRHEPRAIIDLATLTGACVVALGEKCAGLMGTDPLLLADLKEASRRSGERVWELPLIEEYAEQLKSEVADFKHVATRYGGTIVAGLFLKKFVGDIPWAHIDIAGPARNDADAADAPKGGTGFGVQLLLQYLR